MKSELVHILRDFLGPFYEPFYKIRAIFLLDPNQEIYWLYLGSALAVGFGVYVWQHAKTHGLSFNKVLGFCLPRSIYADKSAIVDYKYYSLYFVLTGPFNIGSLIISTALMGRFCKSLLQHIFGPVESQSEAGLSARVIFMIVVYLASDIGFFIAHYLEHKVPFFWEFHKVHHSAAVLNPFTNFRQHPVDVILQGTLTSLFAGTVVGIFGFFYNGLDFITIFDISVINLAYLFTANLRHSHIWLSYGWALSHVFYSPAMHQIHHSATERHLDKNLGNRFSFCDYLAGTLYIPREQEVLKFGLSNLEHTEYSSVWTLLVLPAKKAARLVLRNPVSKISNPHNVQ